MATDEDRLTGLCTRPTLRERLAEALAQATPDGPQPALLALDLDRFQEVNDSTGLATGDGVLSRVARRIVSAAPPGATVARISGDEFAVLLPDSSTGEAVAARLLELIGRPYAVNGHAVTISVSIGLALSPHDGGDADALLRSASIALHHAEAAGKNHSVRFEPWMQASASARQSLETDLRAALALNKVELRKAMVVDQFKIYYQPQVSLPDMQLTGFEALVRWQHPVRGMINPDDFIPLAEEIGLIGLLGDWVMHTACRTAAAWPLLSNGRALQVAVNVSPIQLRERRALVASIADALAQSGLDAARLEVEITESALIGDACETLRSIKHLGVTLALDDFGTGFSSLSQLAHYPFDRLKIDRSFVRNLPDGADLTSADATHARWMIQAIASLGSGLDMCTIAEGVETIAQAEMVRAAGVTDIQGFLISRPVPEGDVLALVRRLDAASTDAIHIFTEINHVERPLQPGVLQP
ncbi:putative bifunctional diguanylate cyclase/phosphodiesterase [Gemmatimonas groenlandica]|uniref:EAL domain-containing protein n=1 Tax=Gemmatimonas groenlandica TaxID=2732249 RepID=A0A6M4IVS4_9BACT|nr:EAL domain-containing protein [Gemmatimonas groenlandica]QJR37616.1 EAL domain-containing protein [Gemmatimonas groenlandica]